MDAKWFCKIDDKEFGPLLTAQLQRLAARGQLKADSHVRRDGSDVWMPASSVPELQAKFGRSKSNSRPEKSRAAARSIPVAAVAPPQAPTPPPAASPPSEPGIQISTHPRVTPATPATPADPATGSGGMSPVMTASLIGLGGVAVILLIVIVFLIVGGDDSEHGQIADRQGAESDKVGEVQPVVNEAADRNRSRSNSPSNDKFSAVDKWTKASSRLRVADRIVGIRSVWVSDDPMGEVETGETLAATAIQDDVKSRVADDDVLNISALGVPKKKRVDVTGRIIEPEAEAGTKTETAAVAAAPQPPVTSAASDAARDPSSFRYVFVQVSLENLSSDKTLSYLGWNGDGETSEAKDAALYDQDGKPCHFVSHIQSPRDDRLEQTVLEPGETIFDVLVFELPRDGFQSLRLALPRRAIGLPDSIGFKINKKDFATGPVVQLPASSVAAPAIVPDVQRSPSKADLERDIQNVRQEIIDDEIRRKASAKPPAEPKPAPEKRDLEEERPELKRSVEPEKE